MKVVRIPSVHKEKKKLKIIDQFYIFSLNSICSLKSLNQSVQANDFMSTTANTNFHTLFVTCHVGNTSLKL